MYYLVKLYIPKLTMRTPTIVNKSNKYTVVFKVLFDSLVHHNIRILAFLTNALLIQFFLLSGIKLHFSK